MPPVQNVSLSGRFSENLGRLSYVLALALAVFTCAAQFWHLAARRSPINRPLASVCHFVACAVALWCILDLGFALIAVSFRSYLYWLLVAWWVLGMTAVAMSLSGRQSVHLAGRNIGGTALVLSCPVLFSMADFLRGWSEHQFSLSMSAYLAGATLLALGYFLACRELGHRTGT